MGSHDAKRNALSIAVMEQASPSNIPIFPLRSVLFPGGLLPLRVFETRYMDMAKDCLKHQRRFGVCLIHAGKEVGEPAVPEAVGCMAEISTWDMEQLGVLQLRVIGKERFRILSRTVDANDLVHADVQYLETEKTLPLPETFAACAQLLRIVAADESKAVFAQPYLFDDASWVG